MTDTNDAIEQKICSIEQQQRLDKIKAERIKQIILNILVVSGYVLFTLVVFAIVAFFVTCVILYMIGNNDFAATVLDVFSILTGIASLFVGIWALYLTITANKSKSKSNHQNVFKSSISENIKIKNKEDDVNEGSL